VELGVEVEGDEEQLVNAAQEQAALLVRVP
jgi:hypothetical protein